MKKLFKNDKFYLDENRYSIIEGATARSFPMFRTDCIVVNHAADAVITAGCWFFLPTNNKASTEIMRVSGLTPLQIGSVRGYMVESREKADMIMAALATAGLDVAYEDMPLVAAIFNAQYQIHEASLKEMIGHASEYFTPLIDAAIAARDKRKITELVRQFPFAVERSFIIDRLKYGPDRFEELLVAGTTLDNW